MLWEFTNLDKYGRKRTRIVYTEGSQLAIDPKHYGPFVMVSRFRYKYNHEILPPSLHTSTTSGKRYLGSNWQVVHPKTTLNDIEWIRKKIEKKIEPETWEFKSSSSDSIYIVKKVGYNLKCNCPGSWRANPAIGCKHVQSVKKELSNG